ncbi:MAG: AbiH family protein, partial [Bacteroidota bacterium]
MNKLIIAGNGFDLAHGLPTSYNHFMDAFWRDLKENQNDELVKELILLDSEYRGFLEKEIYNYKDFLDSLNEYISDYKKSNAGEYSIRLRNPFTSHYVIHELFKFKNDFFKE